MHPRPLPSPQGLASVVLAAVVVLAACSGGEEDGGPVVAGPSQAPSAVSARATAAVPTSATAPPITSATTTAAPTTAPSTTAAPGAGDYAPTPAPAFPARSTPPPTGDDLPDGSYYAVAQGAAADASPHISVTIYELLTGPDAIAAAQADGAGLDSDIYVRPAPAAVREIALAPGLVISVAQPDRPDMSYAVSGAELVRLISGARPGVGAPATYQYLPFPYLVTVQGGAPTRVEQLWSP